MSVSAVAAPSSVQSYQSAQPVKAAGRDSDHDGDTDATESSAEKAKEAAKPVNPNLGNTVNITA